ncbi:MAG: MbcA/ParS/Xre antitoxin family protein [Burkholderiaceae bacterium]|nr:MbcA/ParS/Xre antitoxin family protein [Burkholderiaceae bacterium]
MNSPKGTASPHDAAFDTLLAVMHQILQDDADAHAKNFDASQWLAMWIMQPVPALGWVTPASLMLTQDGVELVSDVLRSMASGAYR